jgi:hypothetical protein
MGDRIVTSVILRRILGNGKYEAVAEADGYLLLREEDDKGIVYLVHVYNAKTGEFRHTITYSRLNTLYYQNNIDSNLGIVLRESNTSWENKYHHIMESGGTWLWIEDGKWQRDRTQVFEGSGLTLALPSKGSTEQCTLQVIKRGKREGLFTDVLKRDEGPKFRKLLDFDLLSEALYGWVIRSKKIYLAVHSGDWFEERTIDYWMVAVDERGQWKVFERPEKMEDKWTNNAIEKGDNTESFNCWYTEIEFKEV